MTTKCNAQALSWLSEHSNVSAGQRQSLAQLAPALLDLLPDADAWLLGLGGPPGTGKSTLAGMLRAVDESSMRKSGKPPDQAIVVLSLDDYYLTHDERQRLAGSVHPALGQRGIPGTHDQNRLFDDIDRLLAGHAGIIHLPRFNKGLDERDPLGRKLVLHGEPVRMVLEGWLIGIPPLPCASEKPPSQDNSNHAKQSFVAQQHAKLHQEWYTRATALWTLAAPDMDTVHQWRWQQEQDLPPHRRMLQSPADVARFLTPFEPFIQHQLLHAPQWSDVLIQLDRDHYPHLQCSP